MKSIIKRILKEETNTSPINRIGDNDKIHMSRDGDLKFKNVPINDQPISFKPKGLWFSIGTEWVDFINSKYNKNTSGRVNDYIYDIKINDSKILTLGQENEPLFMDNYGVKNYYGDMDVDWSKVADDWSGIEILINPRQLNNVELWSTWDIPSGCIWDVGGIKSVSKL